MDYETRETLMSAGMTIAFVLVIGAIGLFLVEAFGGTWHDDPVLATVVQKSFAPSSVSIENGFVHAPKGSNSVTTTNYNPEKWTVIVRSGDDAIPVSVTSAQWAASEPGRRVSLQKSRSPIFGIGNGVRIKALAGDSK